MQLQIVLWLLPLEVVQRQRLLRKRTEAKALSLPEHHQVLILLWLPAAEFFAMETVHGIMPGQMTEAPIFGMALHSAVALFTITASVALPILQAQQTVLLHTMYMLV